ncbi:hypothetical protein B0I32_105423 [Nonomuraea fuscirosea]|uniref:Uncharacterized protein n=1 Tax=Nonomuraea fuscirosea TaxID=1291556 RepID=A0A2T0N4A3_9ACTN|nr:hypothetical protein [Nonomuraea fuscirosea]PRX66983.1 hypothetical protein B0I32_105423 [Nonomuraea fuscirosea]
MTGARAWAAAAASAAACVPAEGAEAAAWTVYGWAEVALGCAVLARPSAFAGLDQVIAASGVRRGGVAAARLRALRAIAGPVPRYYPVAEPPGPVPPVAGSTWHMCAALAEFCDALPTRRGHVRVPDRAASHLWWGERFRPSARRGHLVVPGRGYTGLARRLWMRLPGHPAVLVDVPRRAPELRRRVWRGIHEGAHLDHLAMVEEVPGTWPPATGGEPPTPPAAEFGYGLLAAESYAMAVELVALLESLERGEGKVAGCLRDGLAERIGRLPGFPGCLRPVGRTLRRATDHRGPEFAALPRLAATYVTGPLRLLAGDDVALPARLRADLLGRWEGLTRRWPVARRLMTEVRDIHAEEVSVISTTLVV